MSSPTSRCPQSARTPQGCTRSLAIADLHGDTLLWKRNLLDKADRGQIDLPRLEAGNVALQIFSSVSKTPRGQNYDSNPADTDNITLLAMAQLQPVRTWFSMFERSMWHGHQARARGQGVWRTADAGASRLPISTGCSLPGHRASRSPARCFRSKGCRTSKARRPTSTGCMAPACGWRASCISSTTSLADRCTVSARAA